MAANKPVTRHFIAQRAIGSFSSEVNRPVPRCFTAQRAIASASSGIIDLTMDLPKASPIHVQPNDDDKIKLYDQLKQMEESTTIIRNIKTFICQKCSKKTGPKGGLLLLNCFHKICIRCAHNSVIESNTVDVKCPILDCEEHFQDREVRSLLTQVEYAQHVNQKTLVLNNNNNESKTLYKELMELEEQTGFIMSTIEFECGICFNIIKLGDGLMIRECLHQFCIDCVRETINTGEEAVVKCPESGCECIVQDREIRSLLTQEEFDKYSSKILRIAESKSPNSFHCKKANCIGWAICEDDVIFFRCPICSSVNCLQCQAIHPEINCAEYQENLKMNGMNEDERSLHKMDEIVNKHLGMRCPTCKIVIMKREGCDWLVCSMCKTELCWATLGPRWGPGGRGDTSGGCRCMPSKKCHPKCQNCH